jgi:DNA-binding NtrC family response regulator
LQVKLLRVLQEGVIARVGSTEERAVDVRVVATTKVDLEGLADEGRFRPDLFYRLRGLEIHLPPLRERGDDVLMLADHFLQRIASDAGAPAKRLCADAARLLRGYRWPGNVRELRRAMESAHVLALEELIGADALPDFLQRTRADAGRFQLDLEGCESVDLQELLQEFEAAVLRWAMVKADGRQTAAAKLLQVPRSTLQSKLQSL